MGQVRKKMKLKTNKIKTTFKKPNKKSMTN